MKYMLKYSTILLVLAIIVGGCRKEPNYSDVPEITFDRVEQFTYLVDKTYQDTLYIVVDFQDGDGNLGLSRGVNGKQEGPDFEGPFERGSPYYDNFFANLQIKRGNNYISSPLTISGRFPRLSNDDKPETLEGEIKFMIGSFSTLVYPAGDTIRFEVYLYDRALNKSNTVYTDDIVLYQGQGR
ncbi:hypothetical protein [Pontibacter rugosus]|uniref:Uncharacterized protein n=1 Tax=Pontibacter rugosus TaxID=1745966 RepID=A0ABW3SNK1_9BACT